MARWPVPWRSGPPGDRGGKGAAAVVSSSGRSGFRGMRTALYAVLIVLACGAVCAIAVSLWSGTVGTSSQRRRRREEILRSFDGRPEVKVRVTGTGMSAEETALLGHRYGCAVTRWETSRGGPTSLVMHRTTGLAPAPGFGPPPPDVRRALAQAPNPRARSRQIGALVAMGIGTGAAAINRFRPGEV